MKKEVLFFSSFCCSVCVSLKEKVKCLAERFSFTFEEVNVESEPEKAAKFMVFSAPTVILRVDNREFGRWSGIFSLEEVESFLERIVKLLG